MWYARLKRAKNRNVDGVERTLCANDLMICDATKPMYRRRFGGLIWHYRCNDFRIRGAYFNPRLQNGAPFWLHGRKFSF